MDEKSDHTNSNSDAKKEREDEESIYAESEGDSHIDDKNNPVQSQTEVTNVQPMDRKPKFDFAALKDNSRLMSKLPSFLAKIDAANRELEAEKKAGTLGARRLEIDDKDETSKDREYIEMNLGLGVLEEKNSDSDTSSESDTSEDEDVMEKLMGAEKDDKDEGEKKVVIEEL